MMRLTFILLLTIGIILTGHLLQAQELEPPTGVSTQQDTGDSKRVLIRNAELLTFRQAGDTSVQKLIGNVRLQQDSTLFFCDSAYLYEEINRFEAFGKVRMEMPDSVTMTGKRLEYDGETRIAEVFEDIVLTDQSSTLYTNHITYYRNEDYGYYDTGGQLDDDETTLTSDYGYYYPNQDKAFFRGNVRMVSPDYQLETDTLQYNTQKKVAQFVTETLIISEDGEISTSRGSYDTKNNKINLYERSKVQDSTYTLTADSLYYTDEGDLGIATGEVVVMQEDSTLEIRGDKGKFNRRTDLSMLTDNPIAIQKFEDDTLYIIADTLLSLKEKRLVPRVIRISYPIDSAQVVEDSIATIRELDWFLEEGTDSTEASPPVEELADDTTLMDSLPLDSTFLAPDSSLLADSSAIDTLPDIPQARDSMVYDTLNPRIFRAYHNVSLFMNQMQGIGDSMIYLYEDSIILLYGVPGNQPVLWAEAGQLSGDTIKIWLKNEEIDSMWVGPKAFLASEAEGAGFNQVKGRELRASFKDNELIRLQIIREAESLYFIEQETEDSTTVGYQGLNEATANRMVLYFENNEVKKIAFQSKPVGTFKPYFEVANQPNKLADFLWRIDEKPEKPIGVFKENSEQVAVPSYAPENTKSP